MSHISPRKILLWLVQKSVSFSRFSKPEKPKVLSWPEIDQKQTKSSYGLPDEQRLPKIPKTDKIEVLKTKTFEDLPRSRKQTKSRCWELLKTKTFEDLPRSRKLTKSSLKSERRENVTYKPQKNTAVAGIGFCVIFQVQQTRKSESFVLDPNGPENR